MQSGSNLFAFDATCSTVTNQCYFTDESKNHLSYGITILDAMDIVQEEEHAHQQQCERLFHVASCSFYDSIGHVWTATV